MVRPEDIVTGASRDPCNTSIDVTIRERVFLGGTSRIHASIGDEQPIVFQPARDDPADLFEPAAPLPASAPGPRPNPRSLNSARAHMPTSITVLTPTGTLGYGFGAEALARGMSLLPAVIAVDAGSTDPGPHYLGSGETLVSRFSMKKELADLIRVSCEARIPLIVGSAGGAGSRAHVDWTAEIVREIAHEDSRSIRLATIYSDISIERAKEAVRAGEIQDFEAGTTLTEADLDATTALVAQMGHEPICEALDGGADSIIAGLGRDDFTIASFPIWKGADPALSIHMGKILECGAFSAEPFAMDVMLGTVHDDHFILEPGSLERRVHQVRRRAFALRAREPLSAGRPGPSARPVRLRVHGGRRSAREGARRQVHAD